MDFAKLRDREYGSVQEAWADICKHVHISHGDGASFTRVVAQCFPAYDSVICLDAATGKELWRARFPGDLKMQLGGTYWAAAATPTISGGRCYVQGSAGFYCLSMKDGAVVWQKKTDFSHSSPLVMNGVVYAVAPELTAMDANTGRLLWLQEKIRIDGGDYGSCTSVVPWTNDGHACLIMAAGGNTPCCLDATDGKVLWETTAKELRLSTPTTPVITGDTILVGNVVMKLTQNGVQKVCTLKTGHDRGGSLTYSDGCAYQHMGGGPYCFDVKTGETKWKGTGNYGECNSAVLADGKFIGSWGASGGTKVVMYKASPEKYEELGAFTLNVAPISSPAIAHGKLFLRLEDGVACYDLEKH